MSEEQSEQFQFTEAELASAEQRIEEKKAAAAAQRPATEPVQAAEPLADMLVRLKSIAEVSERERRALPCCDLTEAGELAAAAARCRTTEAFRGDRSAGGGDLGCRWRQHGEWCALEREGETLRLATERLRAAGVPKRIADRVLAGIPGGAAVRPLENTEALRAVRAFVAGRSQGMERNDGTRVAFTGSEWILTLAGPPGTGKSVAAGYAVARLGGLWLSARHFANPKFDLGPYERADFVALDDTGTEYSGASSFGVERCATFFELRHEQDRKTLQTSNMNEAAMVERYSARFASRLKEQGRFIICAGADMRGAA